MGTFLVSWQKGTHLKQVRPFCRHAGNEGCPSGRQDAGGRKTRPPYYRYFFPPSFLREPRPQPWHRTFASPALSPAAAAAGNLRRGPTAASAGVSGSSARGRDRNDHGITLPRCGNRERLPAAEVREMLRIVQVICERSSSMNFGQVLRQTGHFHVGDAVRDHATLRLHTRRSGLTLEVDRQVDADLLVLADTLQVQMLDCVARRVHLQILDDRSLLLVTHDDVDDRGIELLVVHQRHQLLVIESDGARFPVTTVENCRHSSSVTQAAARTFALRLAELGGEFE